MTYKERIIFQLEQQILRLQLEISRYESYGDIDIPLDSPIQEVPGFDNLGIELRTFYLAGIHTLDDLLIRSKKDILNIRYIGDVNCKKIEDWLTTLGLKLSN